MYSNNLFMVLFVGGPLHGTKHPWENPPDYHPHVTSAGMVPYTRCDLVDDYPGVGAIYAPVGMTRVAILECLAQLGSG